MLPPKRKICLTIILAALTVIISLIILYPTTKEIKNLSQEIKKEKEELEKLFLKGQLLKPTKKEFEAIKPKITEFSKIYIQEGNELDFITALENIAQGLHLKQEIDLEKPKEKETAETQSYQVLPLTLKLNGLFADFTKYLLALEALNYYINITNLRIFTSDVENFAFDPQLNKNSITILINANSFLTPQSDATKD